MDTSDLLNEFIAHLYRDGYCIGRRQYYGGGEIQNLSVSDIVHGSPTQEELVSTFLNRLMFGE